MQDGLLSIDNQCVPGVVTALKPHDGGALLCQKIDNFAFALVAPLGTDDDNVPSHINTHLKRV